MTKTKEIVQLALIPFADLVFLEDNPRQYGDKELTEMAADISADPNYFKNRPALVNLIGGKNLLYAGSLRSRAAHLKLGWKNIPCNVETDIPIPLMRKRAILDNTHRGQWDADILSAWEFTPEELEQMAVPEFVFGVMDDGTFKDSFLLPEGDRVPFQQVTFILADAQAERIRGALRNIEIRPGTEYGNENSNGNALHQIVLEWEEQRILT